MQSQIAAYFITPGLPVLVACVVWWPRTKDHSTVTELFKLLNKKNVSQPELCHKAKVLETTRSILHNPVQMTSFVAVNLYAYNYIKTVFTTRHKNTPETLTSSVRQLWANLCTWPRHALKESRPGKPVRGPKRRRRSGPAHRAGQNVLLAGPDTQAGMLSNSQKG